MVLTAPFLSSTGQHTAVLDPAPAHVVDFVSNLGRSFGLSRKLECSLKLEEALYERSNRLIAQLGLCAVGAVKSVALAWRDPLASTGMAPAQSRMCQLCSKQTAAKICSKCVDHRFLCVTCSANIHEKPCASHHKPRQVCEVCFTNASNGSCDACESHVCGSCFAEHSRACNPASDSECASSSPQHPCTDSLASTDSVAIYIFFLCIRRLLVLKTARHWLLLNCAHLAFSKRCVGKSG